MQPLDIIPINFSLTERAASEINRLMRDLSEAERKAVVATLLWNESYHRR